MNFIPELHQERRWLNIWDDLSIGVEKMVPTTQIDRVRFFFFVYPSFSQALEALQKRLGRIVARTIRSSTAMDILKWPALAERRHEHVFQLERSALKGVALNILTDILLLTTTFTLAQLENLIFFIYLP